jgi:hypothetical protein
MKKLLILSTALTSFAFAAQADVTVMSWGGAYGEAQTEAHVKPWAAATGNAAIMVDEPQRFTMSLWLDPSIQKFIPVESFKKPIFDNRLVLDEAGKENQLWQLSDLTPGDCPNVIGYQRNDRFNAETFLAEKTLNWGNHQNFCLCGHGARVNRWDSCPKCGRRDAFGGRTVMLPALKVLYLLGFRTVYLLGVDFEMSSEKKYSFDEERHQGAINCNNSTYSKMRQWFSQLRPYFEAAKFNVINTNLDSKLDAFDKLSFEAAIKDATEHIGIVERERTRGMYASVKDKVGIKDAVAPQPSKPLILTHPSSKQ